MDLHVAATDFAESTRVFLDAARAVRDSEFAHYEPPRARMRESTTATSIRLAERNRMIRTHA